MHSDTGNCLVVSLIVGPAKWYLLVWLVLDFFSDFLLQGSSEGGGGLNFIRQVFFTGCMRVFLGSEAFREKEYFLLPNRILIKSLSSITNGSSFLTGFELEC